MKKRYVLSKSAPQSSLFQNRVKSNPKVKQNLSKNNLLENNLKKISRKGQLEITFHWIFILIAGAAILTFFLMITRNEKENTTEQSARSISGRLEALLSAIQQNPDSIHVQDNINVELEFSCNADGHTYSIGGSNSKSYLDSEILFSPEKLGESKTIAWTKLYASPYPVVQILYFSDEKTYYLFVDAPEANDVAERYYAKLPEQFEKRLITQSELEALEDQGFRKYIIITSPSVSLDLNNAVRKKSTILKINENSNVEFIYSDYSAKTAPYVNDETLFGAIISGDADLYGCTMEKLMKVSRIVGNINLNRNSLISQTDSYRCNMFFITGEPNRLIEQIVAESTYAEDKNYGALKTEIDNLQKLNKEMARANCPTIY